MIPGRAVAACCALLMAASAAAEEVIQIRVSADLEAVPPRYLEEPVSPDRETARRAALEEAALILGGMIYGWKFEYEVGERARGIEEAFILSEQGRVAFGDPRLSVTDAEADAHRLTVWISYVPDESQSRRLASWKSGGFKPARGVGSAPFAAPLEGKRAALEDAARAALRTYLRGTERNRPKEARGVIALVGEPRYRVDAGKWMADARFRLMVDELVPFAAY